MAEELTLPQLRFLTLESQGLIKPYPFGKGKDFSSSKSPKTEWILDYIENENPNLIPRSSN